MIYKAFENNVLFGAIRDDFWRSWTSTNRQLDMLELRLEGMLSAWVGAFLSTKVLSMTRFSTGSWVAAGVDKDDFGHLISCATHLLVSPHFWKRMTAAVCTLELALGSVITGCHCGLFAAEYSIREVTSCQMGTGASNIFPQRQYVSVSERLILN